MKNNEPVITFDHMEEEKTNPAVRMDNKGTDYFEVAMFLAEETLALVILLSMFFLL